MRLQEGGGQDRAWELAAHPNLENYQKPSEAYVTAKAYVTCVHYPLRRVVPQLWVLCKNNQKQMQYV